MNDTERILNRLREQGERLTIQRKQVIEALTDSGAHMTIGAIRQHISAHTGDDSLTEPTIYRILQWLKDIGVIAQTDIAQSGVVYQVIGAPPHHHLICLRCGCISDLPDALFDEVRARIRDDYQFQPRIDHMAIYGYCAQCTE